MTKRSIKKAFITAILTFFALLVIGIFISIFDTTDKRVIFSTFKDLMPLFLGIAAAWLGYCVQRRSAYLQQLRTLWTKLVDAIQNATQYTHLKQPTQEQYSNVLMKLSIAIEEVRGVFCNLNENDENPGLYPFEPLKDIYGIISDLGYSENFKSALATGSRNKVTVLWKEMRKEILKEFDREEPTFPHSHWADLAKARVYDDHHIPKKPTTILSLCRMGGATRYPSSHLASPPNFGDDMHHICNAREFQ